MKRQRDRVDGACDPVGPGAHRLERGCQRGPTRSLAVQPDRQPGLLANRLDELVRPVRLQRAGRIVEKDAGRTEVWKLACLLDEHVRLPVWPEP